MHHSEQEEDDLLNASGALVPLKAMKRNFLEDLFLRAETQTVFAQDIIFDIDSYDNQHVYLLFGEVELHYRSGHKEHIQAALNQLPLAQEQPRQCRAVALTDATVLRIDSDQLDRTLSWSQIAQYLMSEVSLQRDLDEDLDWMHTVLNSNLFYKVPPVNVEQIFSRLTPMVVHSGEVILRQGEIGDCCYFIKDGSATVTHYNEANKSIEKVADIAAGRCFGEDSLVYEQARNATITMSSDGVLMRLEKTDFLLLLKEAVVDEVSDKDLVNMAEQPILVDVRTEEEYSAGHFALSANIPLNLLSIKKRLLLPEKAYVFYCNSGRRSRAAAYLLGKQGYNVLALKGGIDGDSLSNQLVTEPGYIIRDGELISGQ
ncbi:cyclic nucleotide-binding domain-containing protein [Teredinibacter purpureus]|nr:cyclic nucleotide-binding domain-containing protein [Teredinibacter purpureus]